VLGPPRGERTHNIGCVCTGSQGSATDAQCELASTSIVSRAVPPCQLTLADGHLPGLLGRGDCVTATVSDSSTDKTERENGDAKGAGVRSTGRVECGGEVSD
jgi:hypothetical protein